MRDPYSLLGVKRNANSDEIKAAWRTKAKSIHPDHNQDDPEAGSRFAEVGQAYELLKDPQRRQRYDKAAEMQQTYMQQRQSAREAEARARAARANAEKVMEELARANAQRAQAAASAAQQDQAAKDKQQKAQQTSDQANKAQNTAGQAQAGNANSQQDKTQQNKAEQGKAEQSKAQGPESAEDMIERIFGVGPDGGRSETASGTAGATNQDAKVGDSEKTDGAPEGRQPLPVMAIDLISALVRRIRGTAPPPEKAPDLAIEATVTIDDLLKHNAVTLHLPEERDVRVPLENGMTDGHVLRLKGQGTKLPGMKQGDVVVTLKVARDARFTVDGFDLHTVLQISLEDAVLGAEVTLPTPDGEKPLTVEPWSGSDRSIRVNGLGLRNETGSRGDLVVELRIVLWEKPDQKVTDLMRHMRHGLFI
ncbi:DnaJ C-terminal domain-containing protein [Neorhizobium alkalisoli]|nr:DnaJ C-terminal domain-containing protein [Neorhizobium alkalisoli]